MGTVASLNPWPSSIGDSLKFVPKDSKRELGYTPAVLRRTGSSASSAAVTSQYLSTPPPSPSSRGSWLPILRGPGRRGSSGSESSYELPVKGRQLPRDQWQPDSAAVECSHNGCSKKFSVFERRHHCRGCGLIFCSEHSGSVAYMLEPEASVLSPSTNGPASQDSSPNLSSADLASRTSQTITGFDLRPRTRSEHLIKSRLCEICYSGSPLSSSVSAYGSYGSGQSENSPKQQSSSRPQSPDQPHFSHDAAVGFGGVSRASSLRFPINTSGSGMSPLRKEARGSRLWDTEDNDLPYAASPASQGGHEWSTF